MAHPNDDLVREGFPALARGDPDTQQKRFTGDIRLHILGRSCVAGVYQGAEQVLQVLARSAELTGGTLRSEVRDVLANDEHAVALFTLRSERAGKQRTGNWVQVVHMRDGKVSESWLHPADQYAEDEFLS